MTTLARKLTEKQLALICDLTATNTSIARPRQAQVHTATQLMRDGATIPFIARYRKERTGGLDEVQLRVIEGAFKKVDALEVRRTAILKRLEERKREGVFIPNTVFEAITTAHSLSLLEELYAPYKSKRLTKADRAREAGLVPLMTALLSGRGWRDRGHRLICEAYPTLNSIENGIVELLAESLFAMPTARARCLDILGIHLLVNARRKRGVAEEETYADYYKFTGKLRDLKPHQLLALRRGESAGILSLKFNAADERLRDWLLRALCPKSHRIEHHPYRVHLERARDLAYEQRLLPSVSRSLWTEALKGAEERSALVFANNLKSLLLSPPLLKQRVLGIDPGLRTGCKLAAIDEHGGLLEVSLCFTHDGRSTRAAHVIAQLIDRHRIDAVALGNGTGSREAERVLIEALSLCRQTAQYAVVDEAGASVYSASELAGSELPKLDVSERGAVSIARRLQDPLAELIKVDPQSVGVGMYQHDLNEATLRERVAGVVEDAVSSVGADLNTASPQLLTHIAGLGASLATRVVEYRDIHGPFPHRRSLLKVKGLGAKTFEQCAGFLRVYGGDEPLDETAVHPEGYPFAKALLKALGLKRPDASLSEQLKSQPALMDRLTQQFNVGEMTFKDRVDALTRPGRDPREALPPPLLRTKAVSLHELQTGMVLQGSVRNVVDFGAFIDLGVKRDGLIHVSTMRDPQRPHIRISPYNIVQVGQVVEVCITHIDQERGRISLVLTE